MASARTPTITSRAVVESKTLSFFGSSVGTPRVVLVVALQRCRGMVEWFAVAADAVSLPGAYAVFVVSNLCMLSLLMARKGESHCRVDSTR